MAWEVMRSLWKQPAIFSLNRYSVAVKLPSKHLYLCLQCIPTISLGHGHKFPLFTGGRGVQQRLCSCFLQIKTRPLTGGWKVHRTEEDNKMYNIWVIVNIIKLKMRSY